ncbi:hypothetical protein M422DRAFT_49808 [Sphaerobolus stellatus SS14]|uniref:Uncharacterized protein n=1 Tax=Sphaerobolus stellatus (strain SS14) TaxID=990650 RepID=A0A0C9UVN6_SPHS4|nr:hypothetical protein M422DRAFT_49808 [Sphaerobolus stellatus SS14]
MRSGRISRNFTKNLLWFRTGQKVNILFQTRFPGVERFNESSTQRCYRYSAILPSPTPKLTRMPFRDEDVEQTLVHFLMLATPMIQLEGPHIKPRAATSEAEALRKDPFKKYETRLIDL